jgi:hypothetical protein
MPDDTQSLLDQLKNDPVLNSLDTLVDQLQTGKSAQADEPEPLPQLTDDALGQFILSHGGKLVQDSTALVARLKKTIGASGDAEEVSALSDLIASTASAIETLNKIHTQNKKIQAAKDLKQQEIEGKKEVARIKNEGESNNNAGAGLIVASREEIFAMLLEKRRKDPVIDVDLDDVSDVEDTMDISDRSDKLGPA